MCLFLADEGMDGEAIANIDKDLFNILTSGWTIGEKYNMKGLFQSLNKEQSSFQVSQSEKQQPNVTEIDSLQLDGGKFSGGTSQASSEISENVQEPADV